MTEELEKSFDKNEKKEALFKSIKGLSDEAAKNGLTIAKLADLMKWDKETLENLFGKDSIK